MSLLSQTPIRSTTKAHGLENRTNRLMPVKQFGAPKDHSVVKKKALLDVGNTIHRSTLKHSLSKPAVSSSQPTIQGKNLLQIFSKFDKENESRPTDKQKLKQEEKGKMLLSSIANEDINLTEENVLPGCHCHENSEDEFADHYFKNIKPSKPLVEHLALIWENPPTLSLKDKRIICEDIKPIPNFEINMDMEDTLLEDILKEQNYVFEVPPPFGYGPDSVCDLF